MTCSNPKPLAYYSLLLSFCTVFIFFLIKIALLYFPITSVTCTVPVYGSVTLNVFTALYSHSPELSHIAKLVLSSFLWQPEFDFCEFDSRCLTQVGSHSACSLCLACFTCCPSLRFMHAIADTRVSFPFKAMLPCVCFPFWW